jgi:hypothetical protein
MGTVRDPFRWYRWLWWGSFGAGVMLLLLSKLGVVRGNFVGLTSLALLFTSMVVSLLAMRAMHLCHRISMAKIAARSRPQS